MKDEKTKGDNSKSISKKHVHEPLWAEQFANYGIDKEKCDKFEIKHFKKGHSLKLVFCGASGIGLSSTLICVCGKQCDVTDYGCW